MQSPLGRAPLGRAIGSSPRAAARSRPLPHPQTSGLRARHPGNRPESPGVAQKRSLISGQGGSGAGKKQAFAMPGHRRTWDNALRGRRSNAAAIALKMPLRQSSAGGSGAFLATGTDGNDYYVKVLNNAQSPRVPISDQIVGRAARLIGAPVPEVTTMQITAEFVGWEFKPSDGQREYRLEEGIAHAIRAVVGCSETREMSYRNDDNNVKRHAYIFAVYDWCFGNDAQWLVASSEQNAYYSHDHGHYFPGGPSWVSVTIEQHVANANAFSAGTDGITKNVWDRIADQLEGVTSDNIKDTLSAVPSSWPVTDQELESLGFFLEQRAVTTATRLRAL